MSRIVAALLALTWASVPRPARAQQFGHAERDSIIPSICVQCHGVEAMNKLGALTHADTISCLTCHHIGFTDSPDSAKARQLRACRSCHADLPATHVGVMSSEAPVCTDCHSIHGDPPSPKEAGPEISARCRGCHTTEHPLHANAGPDEPLCTQCHTSHTGKVFDPYDRDVVDGCQQCHGDPHPTHDGVEGVLRCQRCHTEAESPAQMVARLSSGDECSSCHRDLQPAHADFGDVRGNRVECLSCHDFDATVEASRGQISRRCASCHPGAMQDILSGGHAQLLSDGNGAALEDCLTCHTMHVAPSQKQAELRFKATGSCIACHSQRKNMAAYGLTEAVTKSYENDFHGQTREFLTDQSAGTYPPVMDCSDCHGGHDVVSRPSAGVAGVCLRCHRKANSRIAGAWLGHILPSPDNHEVIWAVRMFYYVLIPFMLIGLFLNIVFNLADQRREGARVLRTQGMRRLLARLRRQRPPKLQTVIRFSLTERWEHLGAMATFITLVVTGLPQTRPDLGPARALIEFFGGIGAIRTIHRTAGVLFVLLMVTHVARAIVRAVEKNRLPAMVPTRHDFEDVLQTFRHYLFGEPRPRVGKFDFSEKFEYWGLFLGGLVMGSTGLMLMSPSLVSHFLPGIAIAAARVMHGLEASFAVLVVTLWHSYGVILRPEVFPLDTSIFTGKMDVHRLKQEHALEYEKLFPEEAPSSDPVGN